MDGRATQLKQIANGFEATAQFTESISSAFLIGDSVERKNKFKALEKIDPRIIKSKVLSAVAPMFGAVGPVLELMSLFEDSAELQAIKELTKIVIKGFSRMESHFIHIDGKLDKLLNQIKDEGRKTRLNSEVSLLSYIEQDVEALYNARDDEIELKSNNLKARLSGTITPRDAIRKIYASFTGELLDPPLCNDYAYVSGRPENTVDLRKYLSNAYWLLNKMVIGAEHVILINVLAKNPVYSLQQDFTKMVEGAMESIEQCHKKITEDDWKLKWPSDLDYAINQHKLMTSKIFFFTHLRYKVG